MTADAAVDVWREERMLIDGTLVAAAEGGTYVNVVPATEQVIGVAADGSRDDMDAAIAGARRAVDDTSWATGVAFRVQCLRQLGQALEKHADGIGREMGVAGFEEYLETKAVAEGVR